MKNNINLDAIKKNVQDNFRKKAEVKTYILEVLHERLSFFDERSEQEWIDGADPKGDEMKFLIEVIEYFDSYFDIKLNGKGFEGETYDLRD